MTRLAIFSYLLVAIAAASADEVTITPASAPVASPLTVQLSIRLAHGQQALLPRTLPLPEGARVISTSAKKPNQDGADSPYIAKYVIESYKIGPATIPEFEYVIVDEDGSKTTKKAGPVSYSIVTVRTDPKTANILKDIRPPVSARLRLYKYILPLAVFLLAVAIAFMLWRWLARRKSAIQAPPAPPRPPHDIALENLDKLKRENLYEKGQRQEFFTRVSEIMRTYLEGRYATPALERTTLELKKQFTGAYEKAETRRALFDLLETCDLVKFAKKQPGIQDANKTLDAAIKWVEITMPPPPAPLEQPVPLEQTALEKQ